MHESTEQGIVTSMMRGTLINRNVTMWLCYLNVRICEPDIMNNLAANLSDLNVATLWVISRPL